MNILKPADTVGLNIEECIHKCAHRGIRENRNSLKVAVCPEAWEGYLRMLLHHNRPLEVVPSKDGSSARIRVYVCGRPLWVIADETKGSDWYQLTWVNE